MSEGIYKTLQSLEQWAEDRKEGVRTIIGGDFNTRTGRKEG